MRRRYQDTVSHCSSLPACRRRWADLQACTPRRRWADVQLRTPRRRWVGVQPCTPRRRWADVQSRTPRRRWVDVQFAAPEFYGSAYWLWAAQFFHDSLWRAPVDKEVDDLLQDAYFKYRRCIELYVIEQRSCRTRAHLMQIFKTACSNMITDESRKILRCPEKYSLAPFDTTSDLDNSLFVDNSLLVLEGTDFSSLE